MASNKRDPLCATKVGSVKVVWVCVLGNPQKRAQSHVVPCRLGVCVYCARHFEAKLYALNRANAIHPAPQWSVRSKLCGCVFLVTLKGAQSHVVPCRLGVCVYCARHFEAKLYALNRANAIHSAPQWSVRSKLCMCVFVTLKGAQSHVVPCRLGACVYCARHLVARLNGLKQKRSTLRHNDRFGQSCVCVCFW